MRPTLASIVLAGLAACGSKSSAPPIGHAGGGGAGSALAVALSDDSDETFSRTLVPAAGSRFPAVSADGTTVVDLVEDSEDFSGIPIATVVLWTRSGVAESFRLSSTFREGMPAEQAQAEETVVAQINARLGATTWTPIADVEATGEDPDTAAPNTIDLGDGVVITLAQVIDRFPAPGTASEMSGGGGCGDVLGLTHGFGSRDLGFAVVFPRVNLGGDDCFGSPSAETAIVVPLP